MAKGSNNSNKPNSAPAAPAEVVKDAPEGGTSGNAGDAPAPAGDTNLDKDLTTGDETGSEALSALFHVSLPLSELALLGEVDVKPLLDLVKEQVEELGHPELLPTLEVLEGALPSVVRRYVEQANKSGILLEDVRFVIADPATDVFLKSINFLRSIQAFPPTSFYPDFLTQVEVSE